MIPLPLSQYKHTKLTRLEVEGLGSQHNANKR
jgi:hypothetical protein